MLHLPPPEWASISHSWSTSCCLWECRGRSNLCLSPESASAALSIMGACCPARLTLSNGHKLTEVSQHNPADCLHAWCPAGAVCNFGLPKLAAVHPQQAGSHEAQGPARRTLPGQVHLSFCSQVVLLCTECCQQAADYNGLQAHMHHSFAGVSMVQTPRTWVYLLPVPESLHLQVKALHKAWSFTAVLETSLCPAQHCPGPRQQTPSYLCTTGPSKRFVAVPVQGLCAAQHRPQQLSGPSKALLLDSETSAGQINYDQCPFLCKVQVLVLHRLCLHIYCSAADALLSMHSRPAPNPMPFMLQSGSSRNPSLLPPKGPMPAKAMGD